MTGLLDASKLDKAFPRLEKSGHGYTDLNKAITESSDTFFYQTAFNLGIDRFSMWMKRFGFGMPTGIEIQEEATANMPSKEWKQKRYKKTLGTRRYNLCRDWTRLLDGYAITSSKSHLYRG